MKKFLHTSTQFQEGEPIVAMSTVNPQLCKQLGIQVEVEQGGEGPIPHVHVYFDGTRNPKNCAYIRLDTGGYSTHHSIPSAKLTKQAKKNFIKVMESPFVKSGRLGNRAESMTGYEEAVDTWVITYEDGDYSKFKVNEDGSLQMPDYSNL